MSAGTINLPVQGQRNVHHRNKVEDQQEAEAAFTTYGQPYTFISDMWALVGELPIVEEAAKKVGSEVHGQPGEGEVSEGGPSDDPEPEVLAFGKPFDYIGLDSDGGVYEWKITLTKFECGLNEVEGAVSNPDWEGDDSVPEYIPAEAPKGKDFCVAYWTQENADKIPGGLDSAGDFMIGDERHAKSPEDEDATWTLWETNLNVGYTDPINPGDSDKTMDMWTVPEGAEATAIWFPSVSMVQEQYYLVSTS